MKKIAYLILVILVAGVSASIGAAGGALFVYRLEQQNPAVSSISAQATVEAPGEIESESSSSQALFINNTDVETTITQVVQQVGPAVVTVVGTIPGQMTFFGRTTSSDVSGSGVFISEDGYILTNNHVVEDTTELWVILADGSKQEATLIGTDIYADLAVLRTEGPVPAVAALGNSDALNPGETVIAIGSPLGDFMNSVTVGVISATGRSIDTGLGYLIEDLIQTDAAINQGNSGGPLVNLAGEVIAINTLIVRSSGSGTIAEGLGFAIPSNTVQAVAGQIIETGYFSRPYLGLQWQAITPSIARMYRLPADWGVYVIDVVDGSPADEAGLQRGDIIVRIGEVELDETHTYINTLFQYEPGEAVTIVFLRNNDEVQVEVVLDEA
jgi:serine protease Do